MGNVCGETNNAAPMLPQVPGHTGPQSGSLTLNVHEARLTRDVNIVATMDPYLSWHLREKT